MAQRLCISTSIFLLCLFAHPVFASWDTTGTVDYLEASSEVRIKVGSMSINPGACGSYAEYALVPSAANYNVIYSILLSAKMAGKTVSVDLSGCSSSTYNNVVGVRMEN